MYSFVYILFPFHNSFSKGLLTFFQTCPLALHHQILTSHANTGTWRRNLSSHSWSQTGDQERKKGEVVTSQMNDFTVRLYKLILYVKCLPLEVPREKLNLFSGLAECLPQTASHFPAQMRSVFSMFILFLRSLNMKKFFVSRMHFITSVFVLPLEVETAPAAQHLHGALLDLEFLRCELLPSFHREVSALFPLGSWLYCQCFLLVKRQGAIEGT